MKYCVNINNGRTFTIEGENEEGLMLVENGKVKIIKPSTFKRYYRLLDNNNKSSEQLTEQIQEEIPKKTYEGVYKRYYKKYDRNTKPLWDARFDTKNEVLELRDSNYNVIMKCRLSKSKECIVVKQMSSGAYRFFRKCHINRALKHILYNQDIRTKEAIIPTFNMWLANCRLKIDI